MITIVTPWINHMEFLAGYERAAQGAQVILIDNGSHELAAAQLVKLAERLGNGSKCIRNEENRFFSAANNQGLEAATGDVILFLNNDIEAQPGWLDAVARDVTDGLLISPGIRTLESVGELVDVSELRHLVARGQSFPYVEGWCVAGTQRTWAELGGWDAEAYPKPYIEDCDLSWRARVAGMRLMRSHWPVMHLRNGTVKEMPETLTSLLPNCLTFCHRVEEWLRLKAA